MKRILLMIIVMVAASFLISSCQYKFTVEPKVVPPDPDVPVSFSEEIAPIWNTINNCASCHNGQTHSLNLQTDVAYDQIISKGLVNTEIPEESKIYTYPHPDAGTHSWSVYSASDAQLILLWIQQGALNN
ncbi:MAG: hypothetical protein C0595_11145 [Marinilabiliales bacterium]|nr:MAG: hypothetical protein C0595_11145 [Marinilabiliales bacterium]